MTDVAAGPLIDTAHAKINLTLRIRGRRPDGYHELESIVVFAAAGDRLVLTLQPEPEPGCAPAGSAGEWLDVTGPFASDIVGENLISKAGAMVDAAAGRRLLSHILLDKRLPVASGIGGGSADAAAVLRAARSACPELAGRIDWQAVAASLGADVPVCLESRPAFMTGIGDKLSPIVLPPLSLVLANPMIAMPPDKTRRIFQALAAPALAGNPTPPHPPFSGLDREALIALVRAEGNGLEQAARRVFPVIDVVKSAVASCPGCLVAVLSGAGPTVAGIFTAQATAGAAAQALASRHPDWWVCATATIERAEPGTKSIIGSDGIASAIR